MIAPADITLRWEIICAMAPVRGVWPRVVLADGVRSIEHRKEDGHELAVFSCSGRRLSDAEEREMYAACDVPEQAERVPGIGQDRISDYPRAFTGGWRYQVVYRWRPGL